MAFHARIAFTGVMADPTRGSIAIGDTFLVKDDGEILEMTKDIQKKFSEISYVLDDDAEEEEP
jgi:hypothetical protein